MFNIINKFFSNTKKDHRQLNILAIESNKYYGQYLSKLIKKARPNYKLLLVDNSDRVFSLMYCEVEIDIILFDLKTERDSDNIALIKAIDPTVSLIHWSNCKHPEVIEFLYSLGVNTFCYKESESKKLIEAIDLAGYYPRSLYMDEKLYDCLELLRS